MLTFIGQHQDIRKQNLLFNSLIESCLLHLEDSANLHLIPATRQPVSCCHVQTRQPHYTSPCWTEASGRLPTICSFLFLSYTNFGLVSVKIVFRIVQQVDKYSRHGLPLSALPERADRQEQPHSPDCRTSQPSDLGYNLQGRKFHDDSYTRPSASKNRRWNEVWSFKTLSFLRSN